MNNHSLRKERRKVNPFQKPGSNSISKGFGGQANKGTYPEKSINEPMQARPIKLSDPTINQLPTVSICTVTYNRRIFLPLLEEAILSQQYPRELLTWVIIDDSDDGSEPFQPKTESGLNIRHITLNKRIPLGEKRNLSHQYCKEEIVVYMDDDDFYPPQRVPHAVETLLRSDCLIAGSTYLPILFLPENEFWIAGPYGKNHATANTFAMRRELLEQTQYDDIAEMAEEIAFLKNYSVPMAQLDPQKTIICIGHNKNTFEKRQLISKGPNPRMRKAMLKANSELKEILSNYLSLHGTHEDSSDKRTSNSYAVYAETCRRQDQIIPPTIDILIPTMWSPGKGFLQALQLYNSCPAISQIIICDNFPTNKPFKSSLNKLEKVNIYEQSCNIYVNPAWNFCQQRASSEIICILNDDIIVQPNVFSLIANLDWSKIGILGRALDTNCAEDTFLVSPIQVKEGVNLGSQYPLFGSCMFLKRESFSKIPDDYKIWFGDDYLVHMIKNAYEFKSNFCTGVMSSTIKNLSKASPGEILNTLIADCEAAKSLPPYLSKEGFANIYAWTLSRYS